MSSIEFRIDGLLEMNIFYPNGQQVGINKDKDILKGILDNLQQGEYVIGINTLNIYDINDFSTPVYTFTLNATDYVEYMFENAVIT